MDESTIRAIYLAQQAEKYLRNKPAASPDSADEALKNLIDEIGVPPASSTLEFDFNQPELEMDVPQSQYPQPQQRMKVPQSMDYLLPPDAKRYQF